MEAISSFNMIFAQKGNVAPIAEKAKNNLTIKMNNGINAAGRLHYFAIGHVFKNIDTRTVFKYMPDEEGKKEIPTRFTALQGSYFSFSDKLGELLNNIRNLNSHYVHGFDEIMTGALDTNLLKFITEAFELSCIAAFIKEGKLTYEEYYADERGNGKQLVSFLCNRFYSNAEMQAEQREAFLRLTKDEAVEHLLFADVSEDFEWTLQEGHTVFTIKKGAYLSAYACLFLSGMFLYRHEAEKLISKIKGFKRNDDDQYRSKRNIFSFYAKKASAQDISSEERDLVVFRDIVQYLNHYPTAWNKELELKPSFPLMSDKLKKHIITTEVYRSFPEKTGDERFLHYVVQHLMGRAYMDFMGIAGNITFTDREQLEYANITDTHPVVVNAKKVKDDLKNAKNIKNEGERRYKINIEEKKIAEYSNKANPAKEKLERRIKNNLLFTSYGRNQDRFMDIAARYLAETNYFGQEAEFKMYMFYTTAEQEAWLEEERKVKDRKEMDKLKYHQGKLVHYISYARHLQRYPEWDTPFVTENNAIQVCIMLGDTKKIVSIQRGLMVYLLQHALYKGQKADGLLTGYYHEHKKEVTPMMEKLEQVESIDKEEKNRMGKLLPKRLLNRYLLAAPRAETQQVNSLQKILGNAVENEERYEALLQKAKGAGTEEDFLKRNKGKQFKLMFVRKAWQLMYFKDAYLNNAELSGHHKRFNITKEEFNDFCRWMYAFDEVPAYKQHLYSLLDGKSFFENGEFKQLFELGKSLGDFYMATKQAFAQWLKAKGNMTEDDDKYKLDAYTKILNSDIFYINTGHFIAYMEKKGLLQRDAAGMLRYPALNNALYLDQSYYYSSILPKEEYKTHSKLYNKLKGARLEDALQYETALRYLDKSHSGAGQHRRHVRDILNSDLVQKICDNDNKHLFDLVTPFAQIDKQAHYNSKRAAAMWQYMMLVQKESKGRDKDLKTVFDRYNAKKQLWPQDMDAINSHIINHALKYTKAAMGIERYFIIQNQQQVKEKNFIDVKDIPGLGSYVNTNYRNDALHFDVPVKYTYLQESEVMERKFLRDKISPMNYPSWDDMPRHEKAVCAAFLETLHNNFYERQTKGEEKAKKARERYYRECVQAG